MRRTYGSKKEAANVIERRDLFQNLDEKSSAYDAFSIQNIKQTKRELSCVGSSNPLGINSNRVRKKKYVKRIVKEVETPCRESTSRSAYLTPDKSIHVNKPLDPFDLLLMSSPDQVNNPKNKAEYPTTKLELFDQATLPKKQGRTYKKRNPKNIKKFNYSTSSSTGSDKENSDDSRHTTQNMSDIQAHKLVIEQEVNTIKKTVDDSINNIVNNISLINKLKNRYNTDDSTNRSLKINRHRLTRNIQSPLLQKSPLCSTPFIVKYRGESIFKFSPITCTNLDNSPKYNTIEDNNDSNCSVVLLNDKKGKVDSPEFIHEKAYVNTSNPVPVENISCNELITINEELPADKEKVHYVKSDDLQQSNSLIFSNNSKSGHSVEVSSLQTTEYEPFLGFPLSGIVRNEIQEVHETSHFDNSGKYQSENELANEEEETHENINTEPENDVTQLAAVENSQDIGNSDKNESANMSHERDGDNVSLESSDCDRDSLYDTCASEPNSGQDIEDTKEAVIMLERMNDSSFFRYYNNMSEIIATDENETSLDSKFSSVESNNSNQSSENIPVINSEVDNNDIDYDGADNIKKNINESFNDNNCSHNEESNDNNELDDNNEDIRSIDEKDISHNEELSENNDLDNSKAFGSDDDKDSSYNEESSSNNEEEKCTMSFVTTRRRNEATNNSMMSMFNDSYCSSSTDCDKTVLSFIKKADSNNDNLLEQYEEVKEVDGIIKLNKDYETIDDHTKEQETRISFVTTRNSNVTDRKSSIRSRNSSTKSRNSVMSTRNTKFTSESIEEGPECSKLSNFDSKPGIVLKPGKKWERSLSIYRRITMMNDHHDYSILDESLCETKGRKYRQSIISTMEMQELNSSLHNESINSRRSTFVSKPSRSTIRIVKDHNRLSLCNTTDFDDLQGFLNEECDDTIIELSKLSIADQTHEVTVINNFHDTSNRIATARDYVLRRCNQTDATLFDECYPDTVLKNCHKIGEGVYGEVFLWRDRDGRARVLKIVPIAGNLKVNGESQKDFHEIISEIVIAMELSALRAPIAEIERYLDEGKDVEALDLHAIENATDIFNEVLAVRCVYGSYPSRLLDLWDLYDECKGSENDNPAILPIDQQYIVLELANAGQDLESYQFNNAEQAHALFLQVAYGLAVAEEAFQFEHRDLHWGNVLISPTEQKFATFVVRGRCVRVPLCGVRGAVIDYSLSRVALPLGAGAGAASLYNDLAADESLFDAVGDYQFQVYRLMREKLGNDWKNFEPFTNILWLHYTVDKMITALRYKRINTKIHKHYIDKLKGIKSRILDYGSAALFVLTDNEI